VIIRIFEDPRLGLPDDGVAPPDIFWVREWESRQAAASEVPPSDMAAFDKNPFFEAGIAMGGKLIFMRRCIFH
jgi:hypothetical protein